MGRRNWTRQELVVAFNLYCKTPFGQIHNRNPQIIALANALGRTPSALSWKLANFARLDPELKKRNIAGAGHGGKLEKEIWAEFCQDWELLSFESEKLIAELTKESAFNEIEKEFPAGGTRDVLVRVRINQGFFRSAVLAAYNCKCCVTGLTVSDLLVASHIVPWSLDVKNRTNPRNGLCLNAIHDRAFDCGLITIGSDYKVRVSPLLQRLEDNGVKALILPYEGIPIILPDRFLPEKDFLVYHSEHIYRDI